MREKQCDVQDDKGGQPRCEISPERLVVGDAHHDDAAKGSFCECKPCKMDSENWRQWSIALFDGDCLWIYC